MVSMRTLAPAGIITFAVAIYVFTAIIPGAISNFFNASTAGWDAASVALWVVIPIVLIASFLLLFVPGRGKGE